MKRIVVTTSIDASPAKVWAILTDFARYSEWNPGVPRAEGTLGEGQALRIAMMMPSGKTSPMEVVLTGLRPERELGWVGTVGASWLLRGYRRFVLEPEGEGTRLCHSEEFRGLLSIALIGPAQAKIRQGFSLVNAALKQAAEA